MKPAKSTIHSKSGSFQSKCTFQPLDARAPGRTLPILIRLVTSNIGYEQDGPNRAVLIVKCWTERSTSDPDYIFTLKAEINICQQ